jgi:hypothetical protein
MIDREPDPAPIDGVTARELARAIQTIRGERGWAQMRTRDLTRRIMALVVEQRVPRG